MARGPVVADVEDVYRVINVRHWWVSSEHRISSAAFAWPCFSVNVVSRSSIDACFRFVPDARGVVQFNVGAAREIGCPTHDEADPDYPENAGHAHVYTDEQNSARKRKAQRLLSLVTVVVSPLY
jgi:hypothetical protein